MRAARTGGVHEHEPLLRAGLATLGLTADDGQVGQLLAYVSMLQRWNAVHNLSAARDLQSLLRQHVMDCLTVVQPLTRHLGLHRSRVLDAGAGAGLPSVILAIMRPEWSVTAVDAVGKKVAFLRQVSGELALSNLAARNTRLEAMVVNGAGFDVVIARAFSSLRGLVELTRHLIAPGGVWAAMKGAVPEAEIQDLPADCELFHVEPLGLPDMQADRCLIWLRPVQQTAD
jgi:16S rRNA (guanine527-N7)-methyltransferase